MQRFERVRALALLAALIATTTSPRDVRAQTTYLRTYKSPNLNPIRFANKAQCAADSREAATSVFLVVDAYAAGKFAHGIAKATDGDPNAAAAEGMRRFRYTVGKLIGLVSHRLLSGEIPLLPTNLTTANSAREYVAIARLRCDGREYCPALDAYLSRVWAMTPGDLAADPSFRRRSPTGGSELRCRYLKRFSNLQGHLLSGKPSQNSLNQIALDATRASDILDDCWAPQLDSRAYVQLWEIKGVGDAEWRSIGFDYWNSLRIWLSWAWRNLPLRLPNAGEFSEVFRSLPLEEALLFVPNGCESIVPPACDSAHLSVGALRELAVKGSPDSLRDLPNGPTGEIIRRPEPPVRSGDPAGLFEGDANTWAKEFRGRVVSNSLLLRNRLNDGLNRLSVLSRHLPADYVGQKIDEEARLAVADPVRKNQLYYLCAEFDYAANRSFGLLRDDLALLAQSRFLDGLPTNWSSNELNEFQRYYEGIASSALASCERLQKEKFWQDPGFVLDRSGYLPWFKEVLNDAEQGVDAATSATPGADPRPASGRPLLSLRTAGEATPFCWSGSHCARLALADIIGIYSAFTYADSLLPFQAAVPGAPIFNPYAERTACQVYDPWFKTRASVVELMVDLGNAAAFGWNQIPAFVTVDIKRGQVTSLRKLMAEGKLKFVPEKEKDHWAWTAGIDFGSLAGVPCVLAITSGAPALSPGVPYVFEGLSIGACKANEKHRLEVEGSRMNNRAGGAGSGCVACYLSFGSAATAVGSFAGNAINPLKLGVYLFRAFARFHKSMSDGEDVPRAYSLDIDRITRTYLAYGGVPKKCVRGLLEGKDCEIDTCESRAREYLERSYPGSNFLAVGTQKVNNQLRSIRFETDRCKGGLDLEMKTVFGDDCELHDFFRVSAIKGAGACARAFPPGRR